MDQPTPRRNLKPYAFVLGGVTLGALSPVFTKLLLLQDVDGPMIVASRYLLTVLFLAPFGLPHRRVVNATPPDARAWLTLFLVGALGSGVGALLFTAAVDLASAGVVNAISKTAPIFVALFAYFTLRERVTHLRLLLVAIMVAANVLIVAGELTFTGELRSVRILGNLLALGAGLTRAAAEILGKSALQRFSPSTVAFWRFGVGMIVAGAVALGTGGQASIIGLSFSGWAILLALAGISTALYMTLYYRGLAQIPAHIAVTLKLVGAVVTVIVSWIVLAETLTPYHVAGIGVLISGAYLLVMRTADPEPAGAGRERRASRPWTRLRPRLVVLVLLLVIGSVSVVWYLSVRHSVHLVRQQVQLGVGEVAAILVEFGGLEERPSWQAYEQYLQRVVGHRVEGDLYAMQIVYVAALDARGNIGAFAVSPDLRLVGEARQPMIVQDRAAMQRLLVEMDQHAARHGVITATAELVSEGRLVGSLKMGYRREMARGMVGEIVGRSAIAAIAVLLLAALIATVMVGRFVRPIEELTAQLYASTEVGDRERCRLDEVEQIRRALGLVGQAVGVERRTIASLSKQLAQSALDARSKPWSPPRDIAWLALRCPHEASVTYLAAAIEAATREAARQGGELDQIGSHCITARWGPERDDALLVALAALGLRDALQAQALEGPLVVVIGAGADHSGWEEAAQTVGDEAKTVTILIGPDALADAAEHLTVKPLDSPSGFAEVVDLDETTGLSQVAEELED